MLAPSFDSPQFPLKPDILGVRKYANVFNDLEVATGGTSFRVAIEVPTALFSIMRDVYKVPPSADVYLSIDHDSENHWVFSMLVAGNTLYDLWMYTDKTLPEWIHDKRNWIA